MWPAPKVKCGAGVAALRLRRIGVAAALAPTKPDSQSPLAPTKPDSQSPSETCPSSAEEGGLGLKGESESSRRRLDTIA